MYFASEAIVVAVRSHGEHGAIVRVLTAEQGLLAGYVRGGRSRQLRPVLMAGNTVKADLRARTETQLAAMTVELVHGRAGLIGEPLAAAALEWSTALVAAALPEGQSYPRIHAALSGLLDAVEAAPSARGWAKALVQFEKIVMAALGYGVDEKEDCADLASDLRRSGRRLAETILTDRRGALLAARERLTERLLRAVA
ncbi:MAG: recombination protein O N-terminal domain-containing protein [Sphingomonadales bacterium]